MAKRTGYKTLQDILNCPLSELPFKPLSGYRILREVLDILEENGLTDYVEDKMD